jgi:predicted lipoprotein with Yx(FWY)xxD motif
MLQIQLCDFMNKAAIYLIAILAVIIIIAYLLVIPNTLFQHSQTSTTIKNNVITNSSNSSYTINIAYNPSVGNYLATNSGYALYVFSADKAYSNTSACYSVCATIWLPFYSSNMTVGPGLNAASFSVLTRTANGSIQTTASTSGGKQITYNGKPLYRFSGDFAAGQVNGQGINNFGGIWTVATISSSVSNPPIITINSTQAATQQSSTTTANSTSNHGGYAYP